jgi:hypothetical protein
MKRSAILLLLFVYSFSAMGMTIHLHFCCGHLHSFSFLHSEEPPCCNKKMHDRNEKPVISRKCCNSQVVSLTVKDNQLTKSGSFLPKISFSGMYLPVMLPAYAQPFPQKSSFSFDHAPPELNDPVYLLTRNFRI